MEAARPRKRGRRRRRSARSRGGGSAEPSDSGRLRVSGSDRQSSDPPTTTSTDSDEAYFNGYAHVGVHGEMIKDRVRTDAYRNTIMQHEIYINGRVVVDVGCGTGILSIFCAQAGAKRSESMQWRPVILQCRTFIWEKSEMLNMMIVLTAWFNKGKRSRK